jgi:hypothetical protein
MIYSMGRIGAAYNKAEQENDKLVAEGKKKKGGMTMSKEVFKFVGYDWIFLIYTCVFCFSIIYDIVCLSVGAADGAFCLGMLGNILSAVLHFFLRVLLCAMTCCVLF